ncbi:hypothetical protein CC86DRAFT_321460 [Ophiobolus disseminans]|uniref:Uncharacterized protein n=1 Tax=Ophiobolus disseminans TaxID=1469910 RepID=A0A6A7A3M3_9PLEO|nr:hypothetical protein CC86DRAFT_321460 [Ophiobolus disseminans]
MPLISFLATPGSCCRLTCYATRLTWHAPLTLPHQLLHRHRRPASQAAAQSATCSGIHTYRARQCYSTIKPAEVGILEATTGQLNTDEDATSQLLEEDYHAGQFTKQLGSMRRKKQRLSRPATVLQAIHTPARNLYMNSAEGKVDLSYRGQGHFKLGGLPRHSTSLPPTTKENPRHAQPVSLYSILARYLDHYTGPHWESEFAFTAFEQDRLRQAGFIQASVERWAACLLEPKSVAAASVFDSDNDTPPLFLLFLFLRRQHMSAFALGIVLRHVDRRITSESLTWTDLKILSVRLLRHARKLWPESIPWITSLFAAHANALFGEHGLKITSPRMLSDLTRFTNTFLLLLSLPASINPILGALYQEQAQFRILKFMASRTPAIAVTRPGFRAVSRNQLAHTKTVQERAWAELKGPSWPPWKENRTAMDEDKDYEYGASRASRILHRMYEAGYRGQIWENMVEVYAGWDTDFSPTIQTRTSLLRLSSHSRNEEFLTDLLWAGRVRTTRTRREAWACFLACESSGTRASQQVYFAMFEKLYYPAAKRYESQADLDGVLKGDEEHNDANDSLLPGDMKEVVPDPTSPLHYVYLSEPIPTFKELCHRMYRQKVRPSHRLLAFLVEAAPTFDVCLDVLEHAKKDFNGGIGHLLSSHHGEASSISAVPSYLMTAFIRALCQHGHFHRTPQKAPPFEPPERHNDMFGRNKHYLLEYAHALLTHYRPCYRPAWAAYIDRVVRSNLDATTYNNPNGVAVKGRGVTQYVIVWKLLDAMEQIDVDVDDEIFNSVCSATTYAAQVVNKGTTSVHGARHVLDTASPRLRRLFYILVGANMDMHTTISNTIPPHIPGPAELHAYVRALGMLRDYEGLYSFSTWLTKHHVEVTNRAEAQHSGSKLLFRTLVALRAAVTGYLEGGNDRDNKASEDIVQLVKAQIESVEEWGGWPGQEYVELYVKGGLRSEGPSVRGR